MPSGTVKLYPFVSIGQIASFFRALSWGREFAVPHIIKHVIVPWMNGVIDGVSNKTINFDLKCTCASLDCRCLEQVVLNAQAGEFDFTWEHAASGNVFKLNIAWDRAADGMSYRICLYCDDGVEKKFADVARWVLQNRAQAETQATAAG